ncbi:MAG TPA: aminotransferase class I/II-fold pyridoxal phosphate-dependent enzyme [Armatimonadetes bacterium]|nr:aminotransferase class I/II-fold pyridoxal phosphate-dependent enzyme [Armatimonadota bacterium]
MEFCLPLAVLGDNDRIRAFYELAKSRGLALIIDETYRDFHSAETRPHDLFGDPDWSDTLVQLYSFSKAYRLTGHRIGAMVAGGRLMSEVEKFLDSVTICPNQLGQRAALWGMQNLSEWLAEERIEILKRRAAIEAGFQNLQGWKLMGAGAYFAYAEHSFNINSTELAQQMVREIAVLALPGSMFTPEGSMDGAKQMRFAFANIDVSEIATMFERLRSLKV